MVVERRLFKNFDWILLVLVLLVMLVGLFTVSSATQFELVDRSSWGFVQKQAMWMAVALLAMVVAIVVDYHVLIRWSRVFYVLTIGLLIAVQLFGREALGAQRWLQIGPIDMQPSEFAKLFLIIFLAAYLPRYSGSMKDWKTMLMPALLILVPMGLVVIQPDLGTTMVFVAILWGMFYVAGVPGGRLVALATVGLTIAVGYIIGHLRWGLPLPLKRYQLMRLIVFTNPEIDPLGAGYHILQSEIAIGSGRLMGKGIFGGAQNRLDYLPEQHTDFIFSVIGEEGGFIGGVTLLVLFFLMLSRGLQVVGHARDLEGSLLVAGILSMITFHIFVNIGMTIGLMPVTGVPLPFISYGGSSLITNAVAMGIILNVYMRRQKILF